MVNVADRECESVGSVIDIEEVSLGESEAVGDGEDVKETEDEGLRLVVFESVADDESDADREKVSEVEVDLLGVGDSEADAVALFEAELLSLWVTDDDDD